MPSQKNQNQQAKAGFTIIEVVLVLAIAGLIFLMVFVALPALQRSQRDTARRNDMSRVDTSLVQFQTNHQTSASGLPDAGTYEAKSGETNTDGQLRCPTQNRNAACEFIRDYMNSGVEEKTAGEGEGAYTYVENEFKDPDGWYYGVDIAKLGSKDTFSVPGTQMNHMIYIRTSAKCNNDTAVYDSQRHFAVLYRLEGAGVYCIDDQ